MSRRILAAASLENNGGMPGKCYRYCPRNGCCLLYEMQAEMSISLEWKFGLGRRSTDAMTSFVPVVA